MNTKLIALIAGLSMSAAVMAQTPTSGTSDMPAKGQSTATSGEQNATGMQNNSNMQNTATPKSAKHVKKHKASKTADTSCTDGNAAVATTSDGAANRNCDKSMSKP